MSLTDHWSWTFPRLCLSGFVPSFFGSASVLSLVGQYVPSVFPQKCFLDRSFLLAPSHPLLRHPSFQVPTALLDSLLPSSPHHILLFFGLPLSSSHFLLLTSVAFQGQTFHLCFSPSVISLLPERFLASSFLPSAQVLYILESPPLNPLVSSTISVWGARGKQYTSHTFHCLFQFKLAFGPLLNWNCLSRSVMISNPAEALSHSTMFLDIHSCFIVKLHHVGKTMYNTCT